MGVCHHLMTSDDIGFPDMDVNVTKANVQREKMVGVEGLEPPTLSL